MYRIEINKAKLIVSFFFYFLVNLSQRHWKQETWGHGLADVKYAWRGHNILKNSLCFLMWLYNYYMWFPGCNVSLTLPQTSSLLPPMVLIHSRTKRACWQVTTEIQMYLSNVPEQGLTSYERNGKGTILLGSRITLFKEYKMKKFIYFTLLLKRHIRNSMKGRIIPSKMKDCCLGNNSFSWCY